MFKFILLTFISLLLFMIQTRHAWPLMNNRDLILFDSNNDNIVIIIPKPDLTIETDTKPQVKFHTVSCFEDITEEEEEEEDLDDLDDDPLMLFFDEYDYYNDIEEVNNNVEDMNNAFYGVLDFFNVMKDTLNSVWNFPWYFTSWKSEQSNKERENLHVHFDV